MTKKTLSNTTLFAAAKPPITVQEPHISTIHSVCLQDDYAWLRAHNWRDVLQDGKMLPEPIKKHLKSENSYSARVLKPTKDLQSQIVSELKGRIKENDSSISLPDGEFDYFTKYIEGQEHPIFCRKTRESGSETVLLDGNIIAKKYKFCDIGAVVQSPDHKSFAWSCDKEGSEFYTIYIRNIVTGKDSRQKIEMSDGSIVWAADCKSFYYVTIDESHRPHSVRRHKIGSTLEDDIVYREKDDTYFVDLTQTQSGNYAIINVGGHNSSQEWLIDLSNGATQAQLIAERKDDVLYESEHHGDKLFILTNANALDFKISTAPLIAPQPENWVDYIPHKLGVMILNMQVLKNFLVRLELENGTPRIVIHHLSNKQEHSIEFDDEAFDLELIDGFEFDSNLIYFSFSSMAKPQETYQYNLETRKKLLLKRREIPSGHEHKNYITKRIFAKAFDGELIPISLLHHRDTPINGTAPCLLYAYGAYGYASPPSFEAEPLSLVDRGFVYAIAHIRGGTEKGRAWYEQGKLNNKINTFTDFIACAKYLAAQEYTQEGLIVAQGVSAGGMLMGAVANIAPVLFAGIIADVPFVDVLNTILDGDLPLTPPEWLEWGNPITDVKAFNYIKSYSPYNNIKPQNYPAILALGGLTDPRVTYWEPAKWVAKLRSTMTGNKPVLLKTNMSFGHGGASGRFERLDDVALTYAFAIAAVNEIQIKL
jgi:oligopeptidase B